MSELKTRKYSVMKDFAVRAVMYEELVKYSEEVELADNTENYRVP